jgi:hypothetical protein
MIRRSFQLSLRIILTLCVFCFGICSTEAQNDRDLIDITHAYQTPRFQQEQDTWVPINGQTTELSDLARSMGCSPCPQIIAILINGCANEGRTEFVLIHSGDGFNMNDLELDFDIDHNINGPENEDINIGITCSLEPGITSVISNCPNIIAPPAGTFIPANSLVILQTTNNPFPGQIYDFGALCGDKCVYVVKNTCPRSFPCFGNYIVASDIETHILSIKNCPCTQAVLYDRNLLFDIDGASITVNGASVSYNNGNCPLPPPITATFAPLPAFTGPSSAVACAGGSFTLPAITGTNLTGNELYYTGAGGTGTSYAPGAAITVAAATTLYINDPNVPCENVLSFVITPAPPLSITLGTLPTVCPNISTSLSIPYNTASGGTDTYGISTGTNAWPGFVAISGASLPAASLLLSLPAAPAGTYDFILVPENTFTGCTGSAIAFQITVAPAPTLTIAPASPEINCTQTSVNLTATSSSSGASFSWSTGEMTNTVVAASAQTYTVISTTTDGCTQTGQVTVTASISLPTPVITINTGNSVLTCDNTQVGLTVTGGGTYQWSGSLGSNAIVTITSADTYTVTVTAPNGCTATDTYTVTQNIVPPTASITNNTGSSVLDCSNAQVSLTATGGGTYAWSSSLGSTANVSINNPATYTVTITGSNGCTAFETITITQNIVPPTASINPPISTTLTCSQPSIALEAVGGSQYIWSAGLGTNAMVMVSNSGTYTVTVTGTNDCTATATVSILSDIVPPVATINNITGTTVLTCTNPAIQLVAGTGSGYLWSNAIASASNTVNTAGVYTVIVTGTNQCTATATISITSNITSPLAAITTSTGGTEINCNNNNITLTASGGGLYTWSNGETSQAIQVVSGGIYTVIVTETNGCTNAAVATITQDLTAPSVTVSPANPSIDCNNSSVQLTATGTTGNTYLWSTGQAGASISITSSGTFAVVATGTNGCTASTSVTAQNPSAPTITIQNISSATCGSPTGSVQLAVAGGSGTLSISWGTASGNGLNPRTNMLAGSYQVVVTDAAGCSSAAAVTIPGSSISSSTLSATTCNALAVGLDTIILTNSVGCDSLVFVTTTLLPDIQVQINQTSCNPSQVGTFVQTLQTANGCDSVVTTIVTFNPQGISQINLQATTCNPAQAGIDTLVLQNAFSCDSLVITNTVFAPLNPVTINTSDCNPAAAGTFTNTYQTSNGCDSTVTLIVTYDPNAVSVTLFNSTTCDPALSSSDTLRLISTFGCDSLVVTNVNLAPTSQVMLNQNTCDPALAGVDTLMLTNQFGCDSLVITSTVFDMAGCAFMATGIANQPSCPNGSDGSLSFTLTAGLLPANYTWTQTNGGTNQGNGQFLTLGVLELISGLEAGTYSLTIIGANGINTNFGPFTIVNPAAQVIQITIESDYNGFAVQCPAGSNGSASATSNGVMPLQYTWSQGSTSQLANQLNTGWSIVTITDANGCIATDSIFLDSPEATTFSAISEKESCVGDNDGEIAIDQISGGAAPYLFALNGGQATPKRIWTNLSPDIYTLQITDSNGCTATGNIAVQEGGSANFQLPVDTLYLLKGGTVDLELDIPNAFIQWSPFLQVSPLDSMAFRFYTDLSRQYEASSIDTNGCIATDLLYIKVYEAQMNWPNVLQLNSQNPVNQTFTIYANPDDVLEIQSLVIFDRWGNQVFGKNGFQINQPDLGWDGTIGGKSVNPGVYVFSAIMKLKNGQLTTVYGDIAVLR